MQYGDLVQELKLKLYALNDELSVLNCGNVKEMFPEEYYRRSKLLTEEINKTEMIKNSCHKRTACYPKPHPDGKWTCPDCEMPLIDSPIFCQICGKKIEWPLDRRRIMKDLKAFDKIDSSEECKKAERYILMMGRGSGKHEFIMEYLKKLEEEKCKENK